LFKFRWWLLAAGLSALAAAVSLQFLIKGLGMRSWLEVPARVVECDQVRNWLGTRLEVRYQYVFGGQVFVGRRSGYGAGLAEAYRLGREVSCYVNPTDPHDAMLRREVGLELWLLPGLFGLAAAGLGWGAHRALAQQRLAEVATLYSLEVGEVVPVDHREAA
jgi:hypothetical protein